MPQTPLRTGGGPYIRRPGPVKDIILDLGRGPGRDAAIYKILRPGRYDDRILYVLVKGEVVVPLDTAVRFDKTRALPYIQRLPQWSSFEWTTLCVASERGRTTVELDRIPVPSLPDRRFFGSTPWMDNLEVDRMNTLKSQWAFGRDLTLRYELATWFWDIPSLAKDLRIQQELSEQISPLGLKVRRVTYEESRDRVVGFVLEVSEECRLARRNDLARCRIALSRLHRLNYIHGNPRPENFLITRSGQVKMTGFGESFSAWTREEIRDLQRRMARQDMAMLEDFFARSPE